MKHFFTTLFLLFSIQVLAQSRKLQVPADLDTDVITILADSTHEFTGSLPFSAISVLDCRFDTSKIGFSRNRKSRNKSKSMFVGSYLFKKMQIQNGLQKSVEDFYNEKYHAVFSGDSTGLLILIKRFWADPFPNRKYEHTADDLSRESDFNLYLQLEFLLNRNGVYLPVKRIDTVFQVSPVNTDEGYNDLSKTHSGIYAYALSKAFESVNFDFYAGKFAIAKNTRTWQELNLYNQKRFNYPILKDSVYKEGVYLTFNEFRKNEPAVKKYKVEPNKRLGKLIYNLDSKEEEQIVKFWGYCDGKNIYCCDLSHPMIRTGNTFDFFTTRVDTYQIHLSEILRDKVPFNLTINDKERFLEPFQIDLETGKLY